MIILNIILKSLFLYSKIHRNHLFNAKFYQESNPDLNFSGGGPSPLEHYVRYGWREGRSPHWLFSVGYYLEKVGKCEEEPVGDYLKHGWRSGRWPHPLFDGDWYLQQEGNKQAQGDPLTHYLKNGWKSNISPHPLFDPEWYGSQGGNLQAPDRAPLVDYLDVGWKQGKDPHPFFSSKWYLSYSDVKLAEINPLEHYLIYGCNEMRMPNPLFNTRWYQSRYLQKESMSIDPLRHYITEGAKKRYAPSPGFHPHWYEKQIFRAGKNYDGNLSAHYLHCGTKSGLLPCPFSTQAFSGADKFLNSRFFNPETYLKLNGDLPSTIDASRHFSKFGFNEGRFVWDSDTLKQNFPFHFNSRHALDGCRNQLIEMAFEVLFSSKGNFFMQEIAEKLVGDLKGSGADAILSDDSKIPSSHRVPLVVAPHEYFTLGSGPDRESDLAERNFFILNTEQAQTYWFQSSLKYFYASSGVMDFCFQNTKLFCDLGIRSILYTPSGRKVKNDDLSEKARDHFILKASAAYSGTGVSDSEVWNFPAGDRVLDVCFLGGASNCREDFFRRNLHKWSGLKFAFFLRPNNGPISNTLEERGLGAFLAERSKIWLNIHRDDINFFETHRIVLQGMSNGAVVVSEPCHPHPYFTPGVHYFESNREDIPELVQWLLNDSEGKRRFMEIRESAKSVLDQIQFNCFNTDYLADFLKSQGNNTTENLQA